MALTVLIKIKVRTDAASLRISQAYENIEIVG